MSTASRHILTVFAIWLIVIAVIIIISDPYASASSDEQKITKKTRLVAKAAFVKGSDEQGDRLVTTVFITKSHLGTSINFCHSSFGFPTPFTRCGDLSTTANVFAMDNKKLSSATLSPVDIDVCNLDPNGECTGEIVTIHDIEVNWSGTSDIIKEGAKVISREAVATGSADGENLGESAPGPNTQLIVDTTGHFV
jgi:hypothetical protein